MIHAARLRASRLRNHPEFPVLLVVAGALNLVNLSVDGWANPYYSAAVRSMTGSWHNFIYASMDPAGLMTVDKPPLSVWLQAISADIFGWSPPAILIPQAIMGILAAGLLYDLVRRHFGRAAGFVGGLVLAVTPVTVAMSRHNNPDELLALCGVSALWCALRGLEGSGRRALMWSGVWVGLGFETKMAAALLVVPGIALAWLWIAPHGRARAGADLLRSGAVAILVGGAWPLLTTLTAPGDRPWISSTSDNSVWSLIFGYNGIGRVAGQAGGAGGTASPGGVAANLQSVFAGDPAGFVLGTAQTSAPGVAGGGAFGGDPGVFRLLGAELGPQAGWLLGLAIFSALVLLGRSGLRRSDPRSGFLLVVGGGFVACAAVFSFAQGIFHPYYLAELAPFSAALVGAGVAETLTGGPGLPVRTSALAVAGLWSGALTEAVVLHVAPGGLAWAKPFLLVVLGVCSGALLAPALRTHRTALFRVGLVGLLVVPAWFSAQTVGRPLDHTFPAGGPGPVSAATREDAVLLRALAYVRAHGGGTLAVESQAAAASVIVTRHGDVAGLGGFSGRESTVSVRWLADEIAAGHLRWLASAHAGAASDPARSGSPMAFGAAARACRTVTLPSPSLLGGVVRGEVDLYDCAGRAALLRAA